MGAPQIIIIVIFSLSFMLNFLKDGEPKGNYSAPADLFSTAIIW